MRSQARDIRSNALLRKVVGRVESSESEGDGAQGGALSALSALGGALAQETKGLWGRR